MDYYGIENTASQMYRINEVSWLYVLFCADDEPVWGSVCVRSHSVPVGFRFSGCIIPRSYPLAVWFYHVSFEKKKTPLFLHPVCRSKVHICLKSFMGRNLTFFRKTWWWKQDRALAFNFSSNSGDCTSYFTQATSVFSSSSFSLEPPVSTHFLDTGLDSFQVNCTSLVEF